MDEYTFDDALTGSVVTCGFPGLETVAVRGADEARCCASLFFPGCSFVNFGLPLVKAVYDTLLEAKQVEGLSLLCCGKILAYESDGVAVRASFEDQLRESVVEAGVERIVAACPNCVVALRDALAVDERTTHVQVVALPTLLAQMGYRIDAVAASALVAEAAGCDPSGVKIRIHDSCPDRATGEFADGLRELLPYSLVAEAAHVRKRSFCCGSLLRAAGKTSAADTQAQRHGEEAQRVDAAAIVAACMSCVFQLSTAQAAVPVFHYLELLYNWRISWEYADAYMKLRFLFDDATEADDEGLGNRAFVGLGSAVCADEGAGDVLEILGGEERK